MPTSPPFSTAIPGFTEGISDSKAADGEENMADSSLNEEVSAFQEGNALSGSAQGRFIARL
jgi:hypothetical protein